MEKWEVNWTDCFFMPQDLAEIQVEQPQKEDDYQEYTELENLNGFRFEADVYKWGEGFRYLSHRLKYTVRFALPLFNLPVHFDNLILTNR